MWQFIFTFLLYFQYGLGNLWPKGVVHFSINSKDYEPTRSTPTPRSLVVPTPRVYIKSAGARNSREVLSGWRSDTQGRPQELLAGAHPESNSEHPEWYRHNVTTNIHSQDEILSTLEALEHEICVKFFSIPTDFNSTDKRILYITNPDKLKDCPPQSYDYSKSVVDMAIGYKCINKKNIARIVVDMLRASIEKSETPMNSFDLVRKFQEEKEDPSRSFLISPPDRNFINHKYHAECRSPSGHGLLTARRSGAFSLTDENKQYYKNRLWPLGIVMYGADEEISYSAPYLRLKNAMTSIELVSCVVFQELKQIDALKPKNLLWFAKNGAEAPALGFKQGNQSISLLSMVDGAPGHTAHTLSLLMRALGVPMTSNRPDRDNHVTVHWNHVEKGKEHYLEQIPMSAWVRDARLPYDFDSATHAPANYVCRGCNSGQMTVEPAHDNLWKRALSMGHRLDLSEGDKTMLDILYSEPCRDRYNTNQ